jgi:hypothetical protein
MAEMPFAQPALVAYASKKTGEPALDPVLGEMTVTVGLALATVDSGMMVQRQAMMKATKRRGEENFRIGTETSERLGAAEWFQLRQRSNESFARIQGPS